MWGLLAGKLQNERSVPWSCHGDGEWGDCVNSPAATGPPPIHTHAHPLLLPHLPTPTPSPPPPLHSGCILGSVWDLTTHTFLPISSEPPPLVSLPAPPPPFSLSLPLLSLSLPFSLSFFLSLTHTHTLSFPLLVAVVGRSPFSLPHPSSQFLKEQAYNLGRRES